MDKDHYLPVGAFGIWSFTDFADSRWVLGTAYIQLRQLAGPKAVSRSRWGESTTRECCIRILTNGVNAF
jgi:hypothetical protein